MAENDTLFETIIENEFEKNSIAVFDRGLNSSAKFSKIDKANKLFVTRINPTKNYKIIKIISEQIQEINTLNIEKDLMVTPRNHDGKYIQTPLRLIVARSKKNNEQI